MSSVNFAQPDITLRLDLSGVIRRAALSNAMSGEATADWVGRQWGETVAEGGRERVRQMIDDARASGVSPFHQVRQRFPSGREIAVEYTTVRLGGDAGLIAIGRSLEAVAELRSRLVAAQMSMERDYWKLREVETRYRLLFDASTQPVLLIGAADMRIVEANPAAIRALGVGSDCELLPEILATEREPFKAMLTRVREQGKAPGIVVHLGNDRQGWLVRASLVASEPAAVFVLQLSPSGAAPFLVDRTGSIRLEEMIARLPEGFVVLDVEGTILRANRAFLGLVEHTSEGSVLGQRLSRWLPSHTGSELDVLLGNLRRIGAISQLKATLHGELGAETHVALSATGDTESDPRFIGVLVRRLRRTEEAPSSHDTPGSVPGTAPAAAGAASVSSQAGSPQHASPPIDTLGKSTLREIVQETVASVERQCIEVALELAKGNRTVAAQRLGLSRQSLYAKLNRYAAAEAPHPARKKKSKKK